VAAPREEASSARRGWDVRVCFGRLCPRCAPALQELHQPHKKYPHGLREGRRPRRTTSGDPVTTFKRSTKLYRVAMSYNRGLDRDKAGVACEKA
jgi:hypothetical protein